MRKVATSERMRKGDLCRKNQNIKLKLCYFLTKYSNISVKNSKNENKMKPYYLKNNSKFMT